MSEFQVIITDASRVSDAAVTQGRAGVGGPFVRSLVLTVSAATQEEALAAVNREWRRRFGEDSPASAVVEIKQLGS
jgi:hypothetical protein